MKLLYPCARTPIRAVTRWLETSAQTTPQNFQWIEPSGFQTDIVIYNPIVKRKVPLVLRNSGYATWYACGPTVYDSAHIGHAYSYVKLDIIQRIMREYFNIQLITVMGVTDIDDKIIIRAANSEIDWRELTRSYEKQFHTDMASLNVLRPLMSCRVSDYVPDIIRFIEQIINKGGAYVASTGSVYFDTSTCKSYGKLAPGLAGRVSGSHPADKRSPVDFALWKAAKPGEPFWESPWGLGRPGWHIECSAIASKVLGASIDIHSGGCDLVFPHHENEEAQSCSYHGTDQWVNYWLHTGHLCVKDTKMSKSLGNVISISQFLSQYTADQFRLFCLMSSYRNVVEYTHESMDISVTILKRIEGFLNDCDNYVNGTLPSGNVDQHVLLQSMNETTKTIRAALADDFDTVRAVRAITNLVSIGIKMLHAPKNVENVDSPAIVAAMASYVRSSLRKFGLGEKYDKVHGYSEAQTSDLITSFVKFRKIVRNLALESNPKDGNVLKACDEVRADLSLHGVAIKDHGNTSTWSFVKRKDANSSSRAD